MGHLERLHITLVNGNHVPIPGEIGKTLLDAVGTNTELRFLDLIDNANEFATYIQDHCCFGDPQAVAHSPNRRVPNPDRFRL